MKLLILLAKAVAPLVTSFRLDSREEVCQSSIVAIYSNRIETLITFKTQWNDEPSELDDDLRLALVQTTLSTCTISPLTSLAKSRRYHWNSLAFPIN